MVQATLPGDIGQKEDIELRQLGDKWFQEGDLANRVTDVVEISGRRALQ
ncbi:MAG: hypothetical protein IAE79_00245 [Anaerolinea sp.]|nr:hypothetical protein [Anaerolinea sp.]